MACPALVDGAGFVGGMLHFVDCEVQDLGATGYQALAAPGSGFSLALTGLLTLFVALFGYRLLIGGTITVRDGVLGIVKIGIVLVMATSWPAYRTLVYDVVLRAPAEIAADIGTPMGLPGAGGGMVARLEYADRALAALAVAGAGQPSPAPAQTGDLSRDRVIPPPFAGFDAFAFGGSRILFLIAVIGAFVAVRMIAGLLLALAPIFFAFLLFDATRGLFEGWLRVIVGAALAATGTAIVLGIELALIEPWLARLLAERAAGIAIPGAPVELFVVASVFGFAVLAMLYATGRVAMGFRLAPLLRSLSPTGSPAAHAGTAPGSAAAARGDATGDIRPRSRAAMIADAVTTSQRREAAGMARTADGGYATGAASRRISQPGQRDGGISAATPLGQSYRRTTTRVSASAVRRDRT